MSASECYIDFKDIGDKNLNELIQKHGYLVITNVIEKSKADEYIGDMWSWLENLSDASGTKSGIDRKDSSTWITYENAKANCLDKYNWPKSSYGIISHNGIAHSNFVWKARTEPNIKDIFYHIWDTKQLITSFDGACVMLPPSVSRTTSTSSWFHFDQSPKSPEFSCVQGFLNLENSTENDGCLMVYPRSNQYHERFFKEKNLSFDSDWYAFNETNRGNEWMESQGLKPIKVTAPKGSFVLWDSRTVHCSCLPKSNNVRYCIYVCMLPKYRATTTQLIEKKEIFEKRLGTSHWPHKNEVVYDESVLFERNDTEPQCPNYTNKDDLEINDEVLELVGYNTRMIKDMESQLYDLKEKFDSLNRKFTSTSPYFSNYIDILENFNNYYDKTIQEFSSTKLDLNFVKSNNFNYYSKYNFLIEL